MCLMKFSKSKPTGDGYFLCFVDLVSMETKVSWKHCFSHELDGYTGYFLNTGQKVCFVE